VTSTAPTALDVLGRVGTALADPTRRRILVTLLAGPSFPGELAHDLGVGQSNISNHLACLRGCGLVRAERRGRQVRYELTSARLAHALEDLVALDLAIDAADVDLDGGDD
jgi:DNA-binding transcriptional ArsR family regulator